MNTLSEADLKFNRNVLLGLFLYTTLSGGLRKWVFGAGAVEGAVLLIQILSPLLLTFLMRRERGVMGYFPMPLLIMALAALALNPDSHTIYHSAFGFVMHLGFWIMALIYVQERDSFPVEKLMTPMLALCAFEALLGFAQFSLPTDHFINRYVRMEGATMGFSDGGGTRVVGTFSYISGYGAFLVFYGMFCWALMVENRRRLWLIAAMVAMGLVASFMNGGRVIVAPFVMAASFGFLSYGNLGNKLKATVVVGIVALAAVIYDVGAKFSMVEQAFESFSGRVRHGAASGEASGRTLQMFEAVIDYRGPSPIFGIGLGATYQGAVAKWGRSHLLGAFEAEPERIVMEGGYFLFVLRVLLLVYLIGRLKIPPLLSVPMMLYLFFFLPLVFNTNQCTYAFFGMMLVDKLYYLKEKERLGTIDD